MILQNNKKMNLSIVKGHKKIIKSLILEIVI